MKFHCSSVSTNFFDSIFDNDSFAVDFVTKFSQFFSYLNAVNCTEDSTCSRSFSNDSAIWSGRRSPISTVLRKRILSFFMVNLTLLCRTFTVLLFNITTPNDVAKQIAARVKTRRLELNLTQEGMSAKAGIKFATYRRFEQTGEISLRGLLQIGFALNALSDFDALFMQQQYQSLNDVLNEQKFNRKRGKKNE